jgi:hypothetical protein
LGWRLSLASAWLGLALSRRCHLQTVNQAQGYLTHASLRQSELVCTCRDLGLAHSEWPAAVDDCVMVEPITLSAEDFKWSKVAAPVGRGHQHSNLGGVREVRAALENHNVLVTVGVSCASLAIRQSHPDLVHVSAIHTGRA